MALNDSCPNTCQSPEGRVWGIDGRYNASDSPGFPPNVSSTVILLSVIIHNDIDSQATPPNLYYAWLQDTARQAHPNSTCVVCHKRSRHLPHVMPTRGIRECAMSPYNSTHLCPAACLLGAAAHTHGAEWMQNYSKSCSYTPDATETPTDLRVRVYPEQKFPLCIKGRGSVTVGSVARTACQDTLEANHPMINMILNCNTSHYGCESNVTVQVIIPNLRLGTLPLADIFWYCGEPQVLQTLPKFWDGLCTPVLLEGHLTVFELNETRLEQILKTPVHSTGRSRTRRHTVTLNDVSLNRYFTLGNATHLPQWDNDAFVYVDWSGEPAGVPEQYRALQEASSTAWTVILPHVQTMANQRYRYPPAPLVLPFPPPRSGSPRPQSHFLPRNLQRTLLACRHSCALPTPNHCNEHPSRQVFLFAFMHPRCGACLYVMTYLQALASPILKHLSLEGRGCSNQPALQPYPPVTLCSQLAKTISWHPLTTDPYVTHLVHNGVRREFRPVARLLAHANVTLNTIEWLCPHPHQDTTPDWRCRSPADRTYQLTTLLTITVHSYTVHWIISVAEDFGSSAYHAFLITPSIPAEATLQYHTVLVGEYPVWTSLTPDVKRMLQQFRTKLPIQSPIPDPRPRGVDSLVCVSPAHKGMTLIKDLWKNFSAGHKINAPLPSSLRDLVPHHDWWCPTQPPGEARRAYIFLSNSSNCGACHTIARYAQPPSAWMSLNDLQQFPSDLRRRSMAAPYPPDPRIPGTDLQLHWSTLAEDGPRPLSLILAHADFTLSCQQWVHENNRRMEYTIQASKPLTVTTHTYKIRRLLTVASAYGGVNMHAFLLTRDVLQQASLKFYSISLVDDELWTNVPRAALRTLQALPVQPPVHPLFYSVDSSVHVSSRDHLIPVNRHDIWARLQADCRITAPLPFWTRHIAPRHHWYWH
ncbi:hypothetical protein HF521_006914 [Silurus meridionalis]|uniref:Uncharacterized protein n=1 Tax=Silurus meridionalis TaxID=175797 RepID=A0A8T0AQ69_SILME|nr:hypothetical protein HF521_006914 [Silurus meridionalis]